MFTRNNILVLVFSFILTATNAFAQRCTDTDVAGTNQGQNFEVRGMTQLRSNTDQFIQSKTDQCDSAGINLTEYFCSGTAIASASTRCQNGCLDGACSTPGFSNEGCFTIVLLKVAPSADGSSAVLSVEEAKRSIGPLWLQMARATRSADTALEVVLKDGNGAPIKSVFAEVSQSVYDSPDPLAILTGASRVVLSFDPSVRSLTFKLDSASVDYTLPSKLLRCERACIQSGGAGEEPNYDCCYGLTKRYINETGFVCELSPTPMYTPSAM